MSNISVYDSVIRAIAAACAEEPAPDSLLIDLGIDSYVYVSILIELEEVFGITFQDIDMLLAEDLSVQGLVEKVLVAVAAK